MALYVIQDQDEKTKIFNILLKYFFSLQSVMILLTLLNFIIFFFSVTPRNRELSLYQTSYACEGQALNIECPVPEGFAVSQILDIVRANFGRFSIAICNDEGRSDLSVNCLSQDTLGVLQRK